METVIAVSLAAIALELAAFIAVGIYVFLKVGRAAQAVEVSAYKMEHRVEQTLSNGWVDAGLKTAMAVASHFMGGRR
jgi:hypothetical protein